jgi:hypothetical protein
VSWNFSLQKQFGKNVTVGASYVATRQVHQLGSINLNVGTPGGGVASQPFNQRFGRTANVTLTSPVGGSHYDSLQARIERRFSEGLQFQANYTWGKTIGVCCNADSEGSPAIQLPQYYSLNRSVTAFDRTHSLLITGVYELPFGNGKRFLNHKGIGSALLGGWQTNELLAIYSGLPFSVSAAATSLNAPVVEHENRPTQWIQGLHGMFQYAGDFFRGILFLTVIRITSRRTSAGIELKSSCSR